MKRDHLPTLPAFQLSVKPGQRPLVPLPHGSCDAMLIASLARERKLAVAGMLAVVCADAHDTERLRDEIRVFAPELIAAVLPSFRSPMGSPA